MKGGKITMETIKLGNFEIESGKVRVSDPCYDIDTWCATTLENVKKGKWLAQAEMIDEGLWGKRVSILRCFHESLTNGMINEIEREIISEKIGVDSGQAGIFDIEHFKKDSDTVGFKKQYKEESIRKDEPWYSMCCDVTLSRNAGVVPFGVVSSSGFGDGSYVCEVGRKDKDDEISLIEIDFGLNKEDEEEDGE